MEKIGESTLWCEKYRPKTLNDYICTDEVRNLVRQVIESKDVPCFLFEGTGGTGKTTLAGVIANEIGADLLYINGSLETSIDDIRFKVKQFAMSCSLMGGKKLIVIDEIDRMSVNALESLKVLQEQSESNARFIFCTNNLQRIIQPLQSRSQLIRFGKEKSKELLVSYFKRVCFILDAEGVKYDKKILAELVAKVFPDFRKLINELQKFSKMYGEIDVRIMSVSDDAKINDFVESLKAKKFADMRRICEEIDTTTVYSSLYSMMDDYIENASKPELVLMLSEYSYRDALVNDKGICLAALGVDIMKNIKFKE